METKKSNVRVIVIAAVFIVLAGLLAAAYFLLSEKPVEGDKTINVAVVMKDGTSMTYSINTNKEYLRAAIETDGQIKLSGDESEYGLFLKSVNGVTVSDDPTAQEWWCLTSNGEMLMTGMDTTVIKDGDKYEITFTVGYGEF